MSRRNNRRQDEETSYWLSYSDMMAGLLLVFVLIISLTVLRSKIQYDAKQDELAGKEQELIIQSEELENERLTIAEQGAKLNAQELKLSEQGGELLAQQKRLLEQEALLNELNALMEDQQAKLDNIIGIRSELVEALKKEFEDSSLTVSVDEKTGAITMDSSILFAKNQYKLKNTGQDFLAEFMPRYLKILLSDRYRAYISEIVIAGHTDTEGSYLHNLELSQQRAYSVAEYCLNPKKPILDEEEREEFQKVLTTDGKSFSDPILNDDGSVNDDESRRVEIMFRLRDEEMIREMMEILNENNSQNSFDNGNGDFQKPDKSNDKKSGSSGGIQVIKQFDMENPDI